jgi:hypothetical protein
MMPRTLPTTAILALFLFGAVGCDAGKAVNDNPATDPPVGPNEAGVLVDIVGAGTVSYNDPGVGDCAADGSVSPMRCAPVRYVGGSGTLTATPATGWRFDGWSLSLGNASVNAIGNPKSPTTTVLPGTSVSLVATFVPLVHPIKATFSQDTFSTTYVVDVDNPALDIIKIAWSGPNCGTFDPKDGLGSETTTTFSMTWTHPHGPQYPNSCDATTDHKDVTVRATVTIKDKTFICEYQGADTGEGSPCK